MGEAASSIVFPDESSHQLNSVAEVRVGQSLVRARFVGFDPNSVGAAIADLLWICIKKGPQ
jgi:hypothetical protein